jgi:hypothetical protein
LQLPSGAGHLLRAQHASRGEAHSDVGGGDGVRRSAVRNLFASGSGRNSIIQFDDVIDGDVGQGDVGQGGDDYTRNDFETNGGVTDDLDQRVNENVDDTGDKELVKYVRLLDLLQDDANYKFFVENYVALSVCISLLTHHARYDCICRHHFVIGRRYQLHV